MAGNKKIKNASPTSFGNIKFKSTLEKTIYRALVELGISPDYEKVTYTLSPAVRPQVTPYYTRRVSRRTHSADLKLDMSPIDPITYTPDFTFTLNGIFVIVEAKGFVNDVFPFKRNLFRKYLETVDKPTMFFEVRSRRELIKAVEIVKMESKQISTIRSLIPKLPAKDIPVANRMLDERDFQSLEHLVHLDTVKIEKSLRKQEDKYKDIDLDSLYVLMSTLTDITIHEDIR